MYNFNEPHVKSVILLINTFANITGPYNLLFFYFENNILGSKFELLFIL